MKFFNRDKQEPVTKEEQPCNHFRTERIGVFYEDIIYPEAYHQPSYVSVQEEKVCQTCGKTIFEGICSQNIYSCIDHPYFKKRLKEVHEKLESKGIKSQLDYKLDKIAIT